MKGKPAPSLPPKAIQAQNKKLTPLQSYNKTRSSIFAEQQLLGWQIIDMESCLYSEMNITIDSITMLTSLYMKIIEKLNTLQDPRENYFSLKMQKLMAEPYVIRCFNGGAQDNKRNALESRKKELEQKLQKEVQRQNHRKVLQQTILAQQQKQQKYKQKVKDLLQRSNKNLEERIKRRTEVKQMRNSILSNSQFVSSEGYINFDSPKFASNRSRYHHQHSYIDPSTSFQLNQGEDDYLRVLKREIQEEEQEQRLERRLKRQQRDK